MEWFSSDFLHALSPQLADFTKDDITKIWESVSECYRQELLLKKTVRLMGVGTMHVTENTYWYGNMESFKAERPVFNVDKPYLVGKKLPNEKRSQPEDLEAAEVIYAEVALRLHIPKKKVLKCIEATTKVFVWALSKGKNVDFVLRNVGILVCREGRVTMRFYENLLRDVDKTGKLANAFLQTPRLRPLIVARTERTIFRMPPGGVFVLPHFAKKVELREPQ
ncbi:coiled-coil domain-containing protein 81-like [Theristicus caerulescens]